MLRTIAPLFSMLLIVLLAFPSKAEAQDKRGARSASISVYESPVYDDEPVTVVFEGAESEYDWIGIYASGVTPSRDASAELWLYVNGSRTAGRYMPRGTRPLHNHNLEPGNYEVWLLSNDGYTPLTASASFAVKSAVSDRGSVIVRGGENREPELLPLINEARSEARMCGEEYYQATGPVVWNEDLAIVALNHSNDMTTNIFRGHTGSNGSSPHERVREQTRMFVSTGEILSYFYTDVEGAVEGWLNSPGHCRIIMGDNFTHVGGAIQHGPRFDNPNNEGAYRTAVFGGLPGGQAEFDAEPYAESNNESNNNQQQIQTQMPAPPPVLSDPLETASITVYGHEQCMNTSALRRELDEESISYQMRDIKKEDAYNREMWNRIRESTGAMNSVMLPVVDVDGTVVSGTTSIERLERALEDTE